MAGALANVVFWFGVYPSYLGYLDPHGEVGLGPPVCPFFCGTHLMGRCSSMVHIGGPSSSSSGPMYVR